MSATLSTSVDVDESESPPSSNTRPYEIPAKHAAELDGAITSMLDLSANLSAWDFQSEKDGVKAYSKSDGRLLSVLALGSIPFAPSTVLDYLLDPSRKHEYDVSCATCSRVRRLDAHTVVDYFASKSVLMVSGRDFVNLVHWRVLPDGAIVMVGKATTDVKVPPKSGLVRAEVHVAGWKITPHATDAHRSDITFMLKLDLKGSIPGYIQSKVVLDQAFSMIDVTKAMKKLPPVAPYPVVNKNCGGSIDAAAATEPEIDADDATASDASHVTTTTTTTTGSMAAPLYAFTCFLGVLYGLPFCGIDDAVHDVLVWNAIACMCFVLFMTCHR
ncbi:Aste57867_16654 [Aphanomyces stellatus]|uniref:Aste57867_16654 protein n=1 Tax=Aphanomyces stellatus TaxID=120398 RepID=A0A485L7J0_9STRA|nr:hypothetical protein As57867_016597 [Aphanomyces stellatus]VFT93425.1 Aste57867_16654 [Aphanomyces stellatus]